MPNRSEWDDVQVRYKEALQSFLASKEKPADVDEAAKEIPVITISDDNDAENSTSAEKIDDKNSVKKSEEEPMAVDDEAAVAVKEVDDGDKEEAAVVVNPDSSNTDKALTDNQNPKKNHKKQKFKFEFPLFPSSLALYRLDHFNLLSLSSSIIQIFITFSVH